MGEASDAAVIAEGVGSALYGIPPLDPETGHLPPGRYRTTLAFIEQRFVQAPEFEGSTTRNAVWEGFTQYLYAWENSQKLLDRPILKTIWIGGSFISSQLDPEDIDISPVYDEGIVSDLSGMPGIKPLKKLIGNRSSMIDRFKVEPFPIPWRSLESTLHAHTLSQDAQLYLAKRGGLDDWWQRVRPEGEKVKPLVPDAVADRGYLEVLW